MKMTTGAWIGIIGGIIGLAVGMGAVIAVAGNSGIYIAGGVLLFFGGMFFLFYKLFIGPAILNARLQKIGLDGKALIKEVRDTGVTINNNPQVKLIVEIKNYLGQTYTTSLRVLVSRINPFAYQPGMIIPVKIDPKDENVVAVNKNGAQAAQPMPSRPGLTGFEKAAAGDFDFNATEKAKLNTDLEQLQRDNDAILNSATSLSAKATIKSNTFQGIYINGNNPLVELLLEVTPLTGPPFMAALKAAISEQSTAKYETGKEVYVKYEPSDLRKVTIEHS